MKANTRKATFNLHVEILTAIDQLVAQGGAVSKNYLVEQALIKEIKELQRQSRLKQWCQGAHDPLLIKDIADADADFQAADAETARRIG